jgi:endonuclease/exonuclease/phosphatase family metal-dependent hydrolase
MINFPDNPPQEVRAQLAQLRAALDASPIPAKMLDRNVLIATWNVRAFGNVTEKWLPEEGDSPKRSLAHVLYLAEIIRRFDVVALEEVKHDLDGLRHLMRALGPDWAFTLTDLTRGSEGNQERIAFLFDLRRAKPSGLAAELVVPIETNTNLTEAGLTKQFARTPYAVSFQSQGTDFTLVALHVIWGDNAAARQPEIQEIALWMADWANGGDEFGENLMILGDFNIDHRGDPLYETFVGTGLTPAPEHQNLPRTIFDDPQTKHFYDQIAWFTGLQGAPQLTPPLAYESLGGNFDFVPTLKGTMSTTELSWRISDHYPLWASFSVRATAE